MSDWLTSSDLFDQSAPFPDLDILGPDFCPDYNIHDDSNLLGNHSQLSADSPPCSSIALEVDLQDELDEFLKAEGSDPFFTTNLDTNNNKDDVDLAVKEETESFDHLLEDHWQSLSSNLISSQLSHNQGDLATSLKEEDEEIMPTVKDEDDQFSLNIPRPTLSYIRHIQPMPERTSPLPQLKSRKRTFSFSQSSLLYAQNPSAVDDLKEKEVTYLGRTIVPLTHKHLQTPRGHQGNMKSLMRLNPPQMRAHMIPTLNSVTAQVQSSVTYDAPANVVVLVRKYKDRTPKVRRGVSILKPITANFVRNAAGVNITAAKAAHKQSHNTHWKPTSLTVRRVLANKNGLTGAQVQEKQQVKKETPKRRILGRFISWPRVASSGRMTSPSGWVTKEDPLKEKKNQLERDRRGELAMYRDKLRKMLPQTQEGEKVATVTVLERTRDYCLFLQQQVDQLQFDLQAEEEKNCLLKRMMARLTDCQASVQEEECLIEDRITLENFFESFDI